ncbi:MAG: hypothetical protein ACT4OG_02230 [Alphaproteobacteria bacterium]
MPTKEDGRKVQAIAGGGSIDSGLAIHFDLKFADGTEEPFHCDHSALPMMLDSLILFGRIAHKNRELLPGQQFEAVVAHKATKVNSGFHRQSGEIVLRFETPIPTVVFQITMTKGIARDTNQRLETAMRQVESGSDTGLH